MLEDALFDRMDRALILSSDSDFVPALHSLKRYAAVRPVDAVVCPPIRREGAAKEMRAVSERLFGTSPRFMREKQLRDTVFESD